MSRRLLVPSLLLAVALFGVVGPVRAQQYIPTDVSAFTANGSTMIPFRALLEWMGAQVTWDGTTQRVDARRGGMVVIRCGWAGPRRRSTGRPGR
jgi:hypothetical protein